MVLTRVMRDLMQRHNMKLWQTAPEERREKRTGWSHLYKRQGAARYLTLIRDLNAITGITGEERIEALSSNLGTTLMDGIEEFAIYLLAISTSLDDRFSILASALAKHDLTVGDIRERLIRGGERVATDETTPLLFFRAIVRRKIDRPVVREGEDAGAIWQRQDEVSRALARVRSDLTRLLIARIVVDVESWALRVEWTPEMGEALVRMRLRPVETPLFHLHGDHLWIDLSDGGDS